MKESTTQSTNVGQADSYHYTTRYGLLGVAFGLVFPIVATLIAIVYHELSFSLSSVVDLHMTEPLLWIIDTVRPL